MKYKQNEKYISLLLAALLLSSTTGCSFVAPNEGDGLGTSNDNESFVSDIDTDDVTTMDTDREPDEQGGQISGGIKATEYNSLTTSFEGFSGIWADCIDAKLIREWASAYEGMDYLQYIENVNIYTFIGALNIPKDMFYEVCYLTNDYYSTDYDIELLYHGTLDNVKEYYRNSYERETEFRKKSNELKIKLSLLQLIKTKDSESATEYYEWTKEKYKNLNYKYVTNPANTEWRTWSIPEFIYKFDISSEEMEGILDVYNSNEKNVTYGYDFDLIYNNRETVENLIANKSPMEVDELIRIESRQDKIESYTVSFPEGRRFMEAAYYGDMLPNVSGDTIYPLDDGIGYVVYGPMGIGLKESDEFITYKVTVKDGYILSVEEVDTITKSDVIANGKPYKGSLDGNSRCTTHSAEHMIYRSVHITDSEIWLSSYVSGTDNGGTFVGTYTYDTETGDFSAILKQEYVDENGVSQTTGAPQKVTGKLYDYNGFLHFICESSETGVLSPDDPLPLTFVYPSGTVEAYNSYELNDFTWNTVEIQDSVNIAIKPEDIAREYNEITYNNMSFVIVDTKGSKTFVAIKTKEMYTGFREINQVYSNTIEWQTFENVLGNDALCLSYAVGANASEICYFTFENGNLDLILTCNKSATAIDDMVLEVYGSMGATMNLYKYENGELLCCNINSELQKIFPETKQIWVYEGADRQYGSRDLILTVNLTDTSEKYYGWIENGSLHLMNEKDV